MTRLAVVLCVGIVACAPGNATVASEPDSARTTGATPSADDPTDSANAATDATATANEVAGPSTTQTGPPVPTAESVEPVPPLVDDDSQPLPQTEERPDVESASFRRRLELLVEAIKTNDPDVALPAFFPVVAYQQVKAIAKPERDWEARLVKAYRRTIGEYHKRLGEAPADWELRGIDVPDAKVKFMKPHSEGNKVGYFRVLRSQLQLGKPDGSELSLEITSMISWRGEWYVVHLHGFE
jgi:hypothetical protein